MWLLVASFRARTELTAQKGKGIWNSLFHTNFTEPFMDKEQLESHLLGFECVLLLKFFLN